MVGFVEGLELSEQVREQLVQVLRFPLVLTLIFVDGKRAALQQLRHGSVVRCNACHRAPSREFPSVSDRSYGPNVVRRSDCCLLAKHDYQPDVEDTAVELDS